MGDNNVDITRFLVKNEGQRFTKTAVLKSRGEPVAQFASAWNIQSQMTAIAALDTLSNQLWYVLVNHQISVPLPAALSLDGSSGGTKLGLGLITITVAADAQKQGKILKKGTGSHEQPPLETLETEIEIEQVGPTATQHSQSASNSISKDLGANIGMFGNTPTAGVSASYSVSQSLSNTVYDVEITSNLGDRRRSQVWTFDHTGMDSNAAKSTFNYQVQELWRVSGAGPPGKEWTNVLENFAMTLSIKWQPEVTYKVGGTAAEPKRFVDTMEENFSLIWTQKDIPASLTAGRMSH